MILHRLIVTLSVCLVPTAHAVNEFTARLPNVVGDEAMDIVRVFLESNSVPNARYTSKSTSQLLIFTNLLARHCNGRRLHALVNIIIKEVSEKRRHNSQDDGKSFHSLRK